MLPLAFRFRRLPLVSAGMAWLLCSLSVLLLGFTLPAQARAFPNGPGPAAKYGAASPVPPTAPLLPFGMGAEDTAFSARTRYRVVYDRRGGGRFRLIAEFSPPAGPLPLPPQTPCSGTVIIDTGAANEVTKYTAGCHLAGSTILYENGSGVGIGTGSPATLLEVNGAAQFDTSLSMSATGTAGPLTMNNLGAATTSGGFNSNPFDMVASSYNSGTSSAVAQHFRWQAEPLANNTSSPSGSLNLLFASGGGTPSETGLSISAAGALTFVSGQGFPSTVGNPSGSPGVLGNAGMVFHMDGIKYTSLDNLITAQADGSTFTIYDDCPSGTETLAYDPFNPSNGKTYHITIYSPQCVYVVNIPINLKTGDWWYGAPGGYFPNASGPPTFAGTIWQAGPKFPAAVPPPSVPTTGSYGGTGSGSLAQNDYYFLGWTALGGTSSGSPVGETKLVSGTYSLSSYQDLHQLTVVNGSIQITIPSSIAPATKYCLYLLQNTSDALPANTKPEAEGCYTAGIMATITSYPSSPSSNNPPPGATYTQYLFTLGPPTNESGHLTNRSGVNGGMVDCFGISGAVANVGDQDPPSGVFNLTFQNCLGDSGILLEGFDGHVGANGSSVASIFATPSTCENVTGGCDGGIDTAPSAFTVSTTHNMTTVTSSSGSFPSSWNSSKPYISINAPTDGLNSCSGPCQVSSVSGTSLTLASAWIPSSRTNVGLAYAYQSAAFPLYGIHDDAVAQLKKIDGFDYGADNCGDTGSCATAAAVQLDGATSNAFATKVSVHDIHAEGNMTGGGCTPAINAAVDDNGVPATIEGVHTACQITYAVQLETGTTAVHLSDIRPYSSNFAIHDLANTFKTNTGQAIGEYDLEQAGVFFNPAGSSTFYTSFPNFASLTLGTPLAPTSGGTGGTARVCDTIIQMTGDQITGFGPFGTKCTLPASADWFTPTAVIEFYVAGTYTSSTGAPSVTASIQINGTSVVTGTVAPSASLTNQGWIFSGQLSLTTLNTTNGNCGISGIGKLDFFTASSSESTAFAKLGFGGSSTATNCWAKDLSVYVSTFTNMTNMNLNQLIVRIHQ